MFQFPLKKIAMVGDQMAASTPPVPMMAPASTVSAPMPAQAPFPGIAGNGGGGTHAPHQTKMQATPGASSAFKKANGLPALPYPPIRQQSSRAGIIPAVAGAGADFLDGFGNYTLDVLNENEKKTQRPNDPRVLGIRQ